MVRPNIGTVAGGAWVWDDSAWLPWEVPYSANYSALQLPPGSDLADVALPTGVTIRAVEPGMVYELGYDDGDRLSLALRFEGVMPPEPLTAVRGPAPSKTTTVFGSAHHFDQVGRVKGHLVLHGENVAGGAIECLRPECLTIGDRHETRGDAELFTGTLHTPLEDRLDV